MSDVKIYSRSNKKYHTAKCLIAKQVDKRPRETSKQEAEAWGYGKCGYCAAIDGEREDPSKQHGGKRMALAQDLEKATPEELGL